MKTEKNIIENDNRDTIIKTTQKILEDLEATLEFYEQTIQILKEIKVKDDVSYARILCLRPQVATA